MSKPKDMQSFGLTQERLKAFLSYDPDTGLFTYLVKKGTKTAVGMVAGNVRPDGYIKIKFDQVEYPAHWLAWFYMTGDWPKLHLDHINGGRADNRWSNLREVTHRQNQQNMKLPENKHGLPGIYESHGKFAARIRTEERYLHLGTFPTKEEAAAAYMTAKLALHAFARAGERELALVAKVAA